jgi:hypothetical protein
VRGRAYRRPNGGHEIRADGPVPQAEPAAGVSIAQRARRVYTAGNNDCLQQWEIETAQRLRELRTVSRKLAERTLGDSTTCTCGERPGCGDMPGSG